MPIDDPISAVRALNDSDERQRLVLSALAKDFLRGLKLLAKVVLPGAALTLEALETAAEWVSRRSQSNRSSLLNVLAEELGYRIVQIERLIARSEEHQRFMSDEMPGLLLEAFRRAEEVRSKSRIAHLARILLHAAEVGPRDGADQAEEMMRIAMEVTDTDVRVLRAIHGAFAHQLEGNARGKLSRLDVLQRFRFGVMAHLKSTQGEILSVCLKLESYGLVERVEDRSKNNLDDEPLPFGLLQKGKDFVEYICSAAPADKENGRTDHPIESRAPQASSFDISERIARFKTEWNLIKNSPTGIPRGKEILGDLYTVLVNILTEVGEGRHPTAEGLVRSALEHVRALKDIPLSHGMSTAFWQRGDESFDLLSREALAKPAQV